MISIISNLRSRNPSDDNEGRYYESQTEESEASERTEVDSHDTNYDDSDEIPWFGATEAVILANWSRGTTPVELGDTVSEEEEKHQERDDYIEFQSLSPRPRLLSMFDRQIRVVSSGSIGSLGDEKDLDINDLYQFFLEATRTAPPSLVNNVKRRRSKFAVSRSNRSVFRRS
ncbi:unnamed protein product [Agarophyton chilense]